MEAEEEDVSNDVGEAIKPPLPFGVRLMFISLIATSPLFPFPSGLTLVPFPFTLMP